MNPPGLWVRTFWRAGKQVGIGADGFWSGQRELNKVDKVN